MDAGGVVCCTRPFNFGALDRKLDFDRMHAIFVSNSEHFGQLLYPSILPYWLCLGVGRVNLPYLTLRIHRYLGSNEWGGSLGGAT